MINEFDPDVSENVLTVSASEITSLAESIISGGGTVIMESRGNSMKPMLKFEKSKVKLAPPTTINVGDVLLYRYPSGKCILHRLVKICSNGSLICRGDNNLWTETIKREWIVAKVVAFSRTGKWVSVDNKAYTIYWRVWLAIWPIRKVIKTIPTLPRRILNKINGVFKVN